MFKAAFNFLCWIFGVSAGGDPTETKWTKLRAEREASAAAVSHTPKPGTEASRGGAGRSAEPAKGQGGADPRG